LWALFVYFLCTWVAPLALLIIDFFTDKKNNALNPLKKNYPTDLRQKTAYYPAVHQALLFNFLILGSWALLAIPPHTMVNSQPHQAKPSTQASSPPKENQQ
jgi:hypothetical protein